jgi:16S rRNA (guanine966-N2)-methyltransferase
MRIDAGRHRGLKLIAPEGAETRPTSDRARQAIFNILTHGEAGIAGARVLDAFAGSGALGLEALSRGASALIAFDDKPAAIAAIERNVARCREAARVRVVRADAMRPPKADRFPGFAPCDLVFLDPPYASAMAGAALAALDRAGWIAPEARVVVELGGSDEFATSGEFRMTDERRYGRARILFLSARPRE